MSLVAITALVWKVLLVPVKNRALLRMRVIKWLVVCMLTVLQIARKMQIVFAIPVSSQILIQYHDAKKSAMSVSFQSVQNVGIVMSVY